jgi:hypothetical protein
MAFKIVLMVLVSLSIFACTSKEARYPRSDEVPGAYTNTYSVDVIDAEVGDVIGSRTVRDTIFITREGDGYEVSNRKWLQNDYDGKGWVDSMQGEIEPMKTYQAEYNLKTGLLRPLEENSRPPLFLEDEKIYWGQLRALEYSKVSSF